MKKIVIMMFCWVFALTVFSQDSQTTTRATGTNEIHTLFHKGDGTCKIPLGYFIEVSDGYARFGHKSVALPGMSMGIILNHHWTVGLTGNFFQDSHGSFYHHGDNDSTTTVGKHHSSLSGGYGGFLVEYALFPKSKFHVSFPLTIGSGFVSHSHYGYANDSTTTENKWFYHQSHFFVIEPGVKLVVNVIKKMQIDLGISYRYSPGKNHLVTSPDMLNQLTAKLALRFGKF